MSPEVTRAFGSRILDHFHYPRNIGIASGYNRRFLEHDNPWLVRILITLRVEEGLIQDVKFKAQSCVTTVACVSALTEMVQGKPVEEALAVTPEQVSQYLEIVPAEKMYCCGLAVATLHHALNSPASPDLSAVIPE